MVPRSWIGHTDTAQRSHRHVTRQVTNGHLGHWLVASLVLEDHFSFENLNATKYHTFDLRVLLCVADFLFDEIAHSVF